MCFSDQGEVLLALIIQTNADLAYLQFWSSKSLKNNITYWLVSGFLHTRALLKLG